MTDPLDTWLRIPAGTDESEAEANTYRDGEGFRVDWYLTAVGLVGSHYTDSRTQARDWLTGQGFTDYTA